jgi:hypothetical protein
VQYAGAYRKEIVSGEANIYKVKTYNAKFVNDFDHAFFDRDETNM